MINKYLLITHVLISKSHNGTSLKVALEWDVNMLFVDNELNEARATNRLLKSNWPILGVYMNWIHINFATSN